nr:DUF222 domain-containing protein [Tsukamurella sp. PLM1]
MYADQEAEYLAGPGDYAAAVAARRRLSAAAEALQAQVSTLLRVGQTAASHVIEVAIGMVERVPQVFALVGRNVISAKAAETALGASRTLTAEQVRQFDAALADRLTVEYEVLSLPAFREAADLLVKRIDPEAVERRRSLAEQDRRITFRPAEDGMAAAFALLPAADMSEVSARVEYIAGTVCDADPRTVPQRQADGFAQLIRGYSTLGCLCGAEGCKYRTARYAGEPDADGAVTRFITMINVVVNERASWSLRRLRRQPPVGLRPTVIRLNPPNPGPVRAHRIRAHRIRACRIRVPGGVRADRCRARAGARRALGCEGARVR